MPNSRRLPSEGRSCRCKSCHPDQLLLRCRLISRTADFESVNGGANPPAAANRGLGLRSVVVSLAGRTSGGCDTRRLHQFFGSQALTVKPPPLKRQNSEHYRGGPPFGSMAQQSAQLPHKEKVAGANPARAPHFSKRGRAANAARCKRDALTGYEGASPSASTILHPTRRKRRTVLVRQTAGRTSLWMLQFLRMWRNSIRAGARIR